MLTLASGAAIALRQGELMLCHARAGEGAPALGAHLDTRSGLSGECVRTARTLVCADTETDPRVNLDVCRYLGIRSIAVLPICLGREVVGVFEAFSAHPGAFSANEVAALESMRDLVISVIRPEPQAERSAASALGASLVADELPLTPLRRAENNSPPAPFRPVENWPLEPFRSHANPAPPSRPAEGAPPPFRAMEAKPPLAPFRPPTVPDPEDDLICEIEQQTPAAPESESDSLKRAFQLLDASSSHPAAPPLRPAPLPKFDPEDDLICEIEARSGRPPTPLVPEPHPAHAFSAFTPAPERPPEHQVSRKLIAAGVVVALGGLIWLRWCNHSQQASSHAAPASTVQAAVPPAAVSAPAATPPNASAPPPQLAPITSAGPAVEKSPAEETADSSQPQPEALPPQPGRQGRTPAAALRGQAKRTPARKALDKREKAALGKEGPMTAAPPASAAALTSPPSGTAQSAPRAFTTPPAEQLRASAVPANPPPQISPPAFALKPAPPTPATSPPPGQLSLSQAVVKSAPNSPAAETLSPDALRLLLDSAKAGDAGAQLALAVRYANGDGVQQSYPEALKWFTRAQGQGVVPRQGKAAEAWSKVQQWAHSHPQKR